VAASPKTSSLGMGCGSWGADVFSIAITGGVGYADGVFVIGILVRVGMCRGRQGNVLVGGDVRGSTGSVCGGAGGGGGR
jgi:hypothetical protein